MLSVVVTVGVLLTVGQAAPSFVTWGSGLAGFTIGPRDVVIANYSLSPGSTHGVAHHFWITGSGGAAGVDNAIIRYFVDGEAKPSVQFTPAMMCGNAFPNLSPAGNLYSAGGLCGKNAAVGGWFNTFPIPFGKSLLVTASSATSASVAAYTNIRLTENLPVTVPGSGIPLPPTTRMKLYSVPMQEVQPHQLVPLAQIPAGWQGTLLFLTFAMDSTPPGGASAGTGAIEGCFHGYPQQDTQFPGVVLGTGVEDMADSAYYFGCDSHISGLCPATWHNELSGLPFFSRDAASFRKGYFQNQTGVCRDDSGKFPSWGWAGETAASALALCNLEAACSGYGSTQDNTYQIYCNTSAVTGLCIHEGDGGGPVTHGSHQETDAPCMVMNDSVPWTPAPGGHERFSFYRSFAHDHFFFNDGGALLWSVGNGGSAADGVTKCGNPAPMVDTHQSPNKADMLGRQLTAVNMTAYTWVLQWDNATQWDQ